MKKPLLIRYSVQNCEMAFDISTLHFIDSEIDTEKYGEDFISNVDSLVSSGEDVVLNSVTEISDELSKILSDCIYVYECPMSKSQFDDER